MTDPSAATPAGGSVIHDLGYRPYTGPGLGAGHRPGAVVTGFRNTFGLGRSGRSKILPFVLLGLNLLPAVIVGGVMTLRLDELPIGYAEYASTTQLLVSVFVAVAGPDAVLARPPARHHLAVPRPTAAVERLRPHRAGRRCWRRLVFLVLPIVILYAVALLAELDVGRADPGGRRRAGLVVLLALAAQPASPGSSPPGRPAAASPSWRPSRCSSSATASSPRSRASPKEARGRRVAGLLAVLALPRPHGRWTDAPAPTPPTTTGMEPATSWSRRRRGGLAACVALPQGRAAERPDPERPRGGTATSSRSTTSRCGAPRRHRPARPERRRQDHPHRPDVRLPGPVGGHGHPRRRTDLAPHRRLSRHRAGPRARSGARLPDRAPVRARQRRASRPPRPGRGHRARRGGPRDTASHGGSARTPRACASGSSSARHWSTTPRCCCWTSRSSGSTPVSGCT